MSSRSVIYGKYELLQRINVGGMAEVFKARLVGGDGTAGFAIKRILPSIAEDRDFINMFIDEAKLCVQLKHPNIAHTYELGQSNDTYYIAMEYVSGKDLRTVFERLRRQGRAIPPEIVAYILACVSSGLDYAHRKTDENGQPLGIVHRDVSPQNVLLSFDGEVKIIDFGIAKAENKIQQTQVGILKGKFGYMSPEQVAGKPIDHRSDLFSLGIVLHEMLAGERLFVGTNDHSILDKVRNVEVPRLTDLRSGIPAALVQIVGHALAKDPALRYQRAAEIEQDLRNYLNAQGTPVTKADLATFMRTTLAEDYEHERRVSEPEPMVPDEPDWPRAQPSVSVPKIRATLLQHDQRPHLEGAAPTASVAPGSEPLPPTPAEIVQSLKMNLAALSHDTDPTAHAPPVDEPELTPPLNQAARPELDISAEALMFEAELATNPQSPRLVGLSAAAQTAGSVPQLRIAPSARVTAPPVPEPPTPPPPPPTPAVRAPPPKSSSAMDREVTRVAPVPPETLRDVTRVAAVPPETLRTPRRVSDEVTNVGPARPRPTRKPFPWGSLVVLALVLTGIAIVGVAWWWPNAHEQDGEPSRLDLFAAPGYAAIEVKTDPEDAQVFLDGVMVKPGSKDPFKSEHIDSDVTHTVIARKAGYHESSQTVTVKRGDSRLVEMTLLPDQAVVRIDTDPPNAEIWVDGSLEGHSGEAIGTIAPGKHQLSVELECYQKVEQPITVPASGMTLSFTLRKLVGACAILPGQRTAAYGRLTLYSDPPSARVYIDDHDSGQSTPLIDMRLLPGHHAVRLVSDSGMKQIEVDVRAGHSTSQTVMFDPVRRR